MISYGSPKKRAGAASPGSLDVGLLKADLEKCLPLAWRVGLACIAATIAIRIYQTKSTGSIVHIVIDAAPPLADTADLHAIQNIEKFNS